MSDIKVFLYDELGYDAPVEITREQIIKEFFPAWKSRMEHRNIDAAFITEENCVQEWIVIHWAWPKPQLSNA